MNCELRSSNPTSFCRHKILLIVVCILMGMPVLFGCRGKCPESFSIETIGEGEYSGIVTREQFVIYAPDQWEEFWGRHTSMQVTAPDAPEVDFSRKMAVAVFSGEKPTGGYSIEITRVDCDEDEATIFFKEVSPEPGQPVTEALTQPFHIVRMNRIDKLPINFVSE